MIQIKGRKIENDNQIVEGKWTVEEIAELVKEGHSAMLSVRGYTIKETSQFAFASGLTLYPGETIPYEEDGKIIVPTLFKRGMIYGYNNQSNLDEEVISVHCIIEPDENTYITIRPIYIENE